MIGLGRSLYMAWQFVRPYLPRARDERGQTLLEYLILAGVVAVVVLVGIALYADEMQDWFVSVGAWLEGGVAPLGPTYPTGTAAPVPD